jgi:hypothetical protein
VNLPAGEVQIFSDLTAGLTRAHDQHRALGQGFSVAVLGGVQLHDAGRKPFGAPRHVRPVVTACRNHHLAGRVVAQRRRDFKHLGGVTLPNPVNLDTFFHRGVEGLGIVFDVLHDFIFLHEPVGVVALIRKAG